MRAGSTGVHSVFQAVGPRKVIGLQGLQVFGMA